MLHINLLDYLKTGEFGSVKLGMTREDVLTGLGEPDGWYKNHLMQATMWKYGYIDFFYTPIDAPDSSLYMIFCDRLFPPLYEGDKFSLDSWVLSSNLTLNKAEKALNSQNIIYNKHEHSDGKSPFYELALISGVQLYFYQRTDELNQTDFFLVSFSNKEAVHKYREPLKQLSVHIPDKLYKKLQRISSKRREKISKISSDLLIDAISRLKDE